MNSTAPPFLQTVALSPNFALPVGLAIAALGLFFLNPWLSLPLLLFALFLTWQTATLRLYFTPTALEIYRQSTLIRRFPYSEWQNWQIFWSPLPILFYFKEIKSIHFVPILFDPQLLRQCLEERCPQQVSSPQA